MATLINPSPVAPDVGSVLLVINSYSSGTSPCQYLPRADIALEEYVKTFYQHLFFRVYTALDRETREDLEKSILEYTRLSKDNGLDKTAFVFVGHGALEDGIEYIFTNAGEGVPIYKVIEHFNTSLPAGRNKLFFIDACRAGDTIRPPAYPPLPEDTFLAYSTLSCQIAWYDTANPIRPRTYGAWSYCFNELIRDMIAPLGIVMPSVDAKMKKDLKISQMAVFNSSGKCAAITLNNGKIRDLIPVLQEEITVYRRKLKQSKPDSSIRIMERPDIQVHFDNVLNGIRKILAAASSDDLKSIHTLIERQCRSKAGQLPFGAIIGETANEIHSFLMQWNGILSDFSVTIAPIVTHYGCEELKETLCILDKKISESLPQSIFSVDSRPYAIDNATKNPDIARIVFKVASDEIAFEQICSLQSFLKRCNVHVPLFFGWRDGCVELIFSADADSALLLPSETLDRLNELSDLLVTEVTLFKCIEITVRDGTAEFVGSEADFQQLSARYVKMKNKLEKLSTEEDIMSTSSTKAEIHVIEDVEAVLSKLIATWKLVQKWHQSKMKGVETLSGAMETTAALSPSGIRMPEEERRQSEMLGVETPSGLMQTSSQSTESDVVKTEMVAQQGIVRKIGPISEDILPATAQDFDPEEFMERFKDRFLTSVDSHAIVLRLEIEKVIPLQLSYAIKTQDIGGGNKELFLYLRRHADPEGIRSLCDVMNIDGYPKMSKLGQDMKRYLYLLTNPNPTPHPVDILVDQPKPHQPIPSLTSPDHTH